jgi:ubiquinone/menaquinone biosynthesis C-methylase UbiE
VHYHLSAGRSCRLRLHQQLCCDLVSNTDHAQLRSSWLGHWSGLDHPFHADGHLAFPCVARRLGKARCKNGTLHFCSSASGKYLVVLGFLWTAVSSGRIGCHSSAVGPDTSDDSQVLADLKMGWRASTALHFVGELCVVFEFHHLEIELATEVQPMNTKEIVKRQFDIQAKNFSRWSVTKNQEYMQAYFEFIGFGKEDELLDVACGTGAFSVFCAKRIKHVHGIDISKGMIELAQKNALASGLENITFECHDVEHIPCPVNSFCVVQCRSAFHHMEKYPLVFEEMLRCCRPNGRLALQDIMAYDDQRVNSFFEALEKEVDVSHNATLSKQDFFDLFTRNRIEVVRSFVVGIELNFSEYLGHAFQSQGSVEKIEDLLKYGLQDIDISRFLYMNNDGELTLKRSVFLILGQKR